MKSENFESSRVSYRMSRILFHVISSSDFWPMAMILISGNSQQIYFKELFHIFRKYLYIFVLIKFNMIICYYLRDAFKTRIHNGCNL